MVSYFKLNCIIILDMRENNEEKEIYNQNCVVI